MVFTFILPPDHNSGPWCKMLLSSEENVGTRIAHWLQNSWIHYSCFTSMCVAKKDQSGLSASLCKLSRRYLDLSFMFLCQSRVNDNVIRFSSCFGGAVRNFFRKNNVLLKLLGRIGWTANRCLAFPRNFVSLHISWQPLSSGAKLINTEIGLNPNNQDAINRGRNSAKYRICRNFSASLSLPHASALTQLQAIEAPVGKFAKMQKCKKCKIQNTCCQSSSKLAWPEK